MSVFVLHQLLVIVCAWTLADAAFMRAEPWRRRLAALALVPTLHIVVLQVLGIWGVLRAWNAVVGLTLVLIVGLAVRHHLFRQAESSPTRSEPSAPGSSGPAAWLLIACALCCLWVFAGEVGWGPPTPDTDTMSYHLAAPIEWLLGERLSLAPPNYHAYYSLNAELFSLNFMLGPGHDGLLHLCGLFWSLLAGASLYRLVRLQGGAPSTSLCATGFLLVSPIVVLAASRPTAVDIAGPACLLAAIALSAPPPKQTASCCGARATWLGLLTGTAAGIRITLAPGLVLVALAFLWRGCSDASPRHRAAHAFTIAWAALLSGSYWYARNFVLTGNPLFPAAFGPFDGPFDAVSQARTKLITWVLDPPAPASPLLEILRAHLDWGGALGYLSLAGFVGGILFVLFTIRKPPTPARHIRMLVLACGLLLLATYPFTPFSGTNNSASGDMRVSLRFLIPSYALGLALAAGAVQGSRTWWLVFTAVAVTVTATLDPPIVPIVLAVVGTLFAAGWRLIPFPPLTTRQLRLAVAGTLLGAFALIAIMEGSWKGRFDDEVFGVRSRGVHMGAAWRALESLPDGMRITAQGPGSYRIAPYFGRRLQHRFVSVPLKEPPYLHLHERDWKGRRWWDRTQLAYDPATYLAALRQERVDCVVVLRKPNGSWPEPQQTLASEGSARIHACGETYCVWCLDRAADLTE